MNLTLKPKMPMKNQISKKGGLPYSQKKQTVILNTQLRNYQSAQSLNALIVNKCLNNTDSLEQPGFSSHSQEKHIDSVQPIDIRSQLSNLLSARTNQRIQNIKNNYLSKIH